jgi:hypothetical protein
MPALSMVAVALTSGAVGILIGARIQAHTAPRKEYIITHREGPRYQPDWDKLGQPLQYAPVMLLCGGCGRTVFASDGFNPDPHQCYEEISEKPKTPLAS